MSINEALEHLKYYQRWRRSTDCEQPSPYTIGIALDTLIEYVETNETKNTDRKDWIQHLNKKENLWTLKNL